MLEQTFIVPEDSTPDRVDKILAAHYPEVSRAAIQRFIESGKVRRENVGGGRRRSTPRAHSFSLRTAVLLANQLDSGASRLPHRATWSARDSHLTPLGAPCRDQY